MIAPAVLARLKAGVIAAVSMCGGVDGAEVTVGRDRSTTGNWRNPNHPAMPRIDHAFMLDQVAALQGRCPPIISAYAADLGHVVIRLPAGSACEDSLATALIDASAEFGDIADALREATRDGKICEGDRKRIVAQIDEAVLALVRMRAATSGED